MESKFLSDGRKVAIIGKLNNDETIVQEIFVTESGDEIPSGERFITKSLHDSPVKSYKQKEAERSELRMNQLKVEKLQCEKEVRAIQSKLQGFRAIFKQVDALANNIEEKDLDVLVSVMSGSCKWVVFDGYEVTAPQPYDENLIRYENSYGDRRFESIKLVSFMGRVDGDPEYRLHQYSDNSGSSQKIMPFEDYSEAIDYIKTVSLEKLSRDILSVADFKTCVNLGIEFDIEDKERLINKNVASLEANKQTILGSAKKAADQYNKDIEYLNSIIGG